MRPPLLGLLLAAAVLPACGSPPSEPFTIEVSGRYFFTMEYDQGCASEQEPGECVISPVVLLQTGEEVVVQPIGVGVIEELAVVFGSEMVDFCDLSQATLSFIGIYDGRDITGDFSGQGVRSGFGECQIESGSFSLVRIEDGE